MSSRGPYRRHTPEFKLLLCQQIRSGAIGRREVQRKYSLSANLVQLWLTQYDRGELGREEVEASVVAEYEAKIAALRGRNWPTRAKEAFSLLAENPPLAPALHRNFRVRRRSPLLADWSQNGDQFARRKPAVRRRFVAKSSSVKLR